MSVLSIPLSVNQIDAERKIEATPSFLIGLMNYSRKHVSNDEEVMKLANSFKGLDILTRHDIEKMADDDVATKVVKPKNLLADPESSEVSEERSIEDVFRSSEEGELPVTIIQTPDQLLDIAEYLLAHNADTTNFSAYDVVVTLRNMLRMVEDNEKLTPETLENVLVQSAGTPIEEVSPRADTRVRPGTGTRELGPESQVFISRDPETELSPLPQGFGGPITQEEIGGVTQVPRSEWGTYAPQTPAEQGVAGVETDAPPAAEEPTTAPGRRRRAS